MLVRYVHIPPLIKLHASWGCLDLLRPARLLARITASKQHSAHHIHQWVSLPRDLDGKVLLTNLRQGIIPEADFFNLCCVVSSQVTEEIRTPALDGQQQQADKVDQRQRREDTGIRAGTADILHTQLGVGRRELGSENEQGLVGAAEIAREQVWEDCAGRIDGCGVGFVDGVPFKLEFREGLGGFGGA